MSLKSVTRNVELAGNSVQLRMNLLGPPEVHLDDHWVKFPTRKTLALLVYLALETAPQPRLHLAPLLWPEASPRRSRATLRNTLGHLQTSLRTDPNPGQKDYILVTHDTLALNLAADISIDLWGVERAYMLARSGQTAQNDAASLSLLQSAVACQRGEFLAGFSLGDAPGFDDWIDIQREIWRRRLVLILNRLSDMQLVHGDFAGAVESASHWIALDTLNEAAYRRKMSAHFSAGERGQALETYVLCRTVLAAELGLAPTRETEMLARQVRSQPVPSFKFKPDSPFTFLESLFVGRNAELMKLVECYRRSANGRPQVVLLRGEIGIGKTHLARKFLTWARAQGAEILQGDALMSESKLPFLPLVEALRLWLAHENAPKDMLGEVWLSRLCQQLPELHQRYPALPLLNQETSGEVGFFDTFVHITLALIKRGPLVLFVDDLHWVDRATLDVLQYAIRRWRASSAAVLLVVSFSSNPSLEGVPPGDLAGLSAWVEYVERETAPYEVELEPLGEADVMQKVQAILSSPDVGFASWLYDQTSGQPFYLMETLKDLFRQGWLHPKLLTEEHWIFTLDRGQEWLRGSEVSEYIPPVVRAVVQERLKRLSQNAFSMLTAGAVLERQITFERLRAVAHLPEDAGLLALDELLGVRFLREESRPDAASEFVFANQMLRTVVYKEAGEARRRLFCQRASDVFL